MSRLHSEQTAVCAWALAAGSQLGLSEAGAQFPCRGSHCEHGPSEAKGTDCEIMTVRREAKCCLLGSAGMWSIITCN